MFPGSDIGGWDGLENPVVKKLIRSSQIWAPSVREPPTWPGRGRVPMSMVTGFEIFSETIMEVISPWLKPREIDLFPANISRTVMSWEIRCFRQLRNFLKFLGMHGALTNILGHWLWLASQTAARPGHRAAHLAAQFNHSVVNQYSPPDTCCTLNILLKLMYQGPGNANGTPNISSPMTWDWVNASGLWSHPFAGLPIP